MESDWVSLAKLQPTAEAALWSRLRKTAPSTSCGYQTTTWHRKTGHGKLIKNLRVFFVKSNNIKFIFKNNTCKNKSKTTFKCSNLKEILLVNPHDWKPWGFFDCQVHMSLHMSSRVNSDLKPNSFSARVEDAKQLATSPGLLSTIS